MSRAPLPPPERGSALFKRMEVRTITLTRLPRYPRRARLGERLKAAWAAFWGAAR